MPSSKKEFVTKLLSDKTPDYIMENFNYVVNMFEREERTTSNNLVRSAQQDAVSKDAKVVRPQMVSESVSVPSRDQVTSYLENLKKVK